MEERKKRGLNQTEMGDLLGVTKVSVCGYENGTRTPTLEKFENILDITNLDANYLLGRDIRIVAEKEEDYSVKLPNEMIVFYNEIRKNKPIYNKLIENPKRLVDIMNKKIMK